MSQYPPPLTALLDHQVLDKPTERALLIRAKTGDADALNEICRCNQRHVYRIARRYYNFGYGGDQQLFDLIQWGNLGLLHAIRKWDGREGAFSTYAHYWIRAYIRRYAIIRGIRFGISYNQGESIGNIRAGRARLTQRLCTDEPTTEQIASETNKKPGDVEFSTKIVRSVISLDDENHRMRPDSEGDLNLHDILTDDTASETLDELSEASDLYSALAILSHREQYILSHRFGLRGSEYMSYDDLAKHYRVSRTRIQQIYAVALIKLKARLKH